MAVNTILYNETLIRFLINRNRERFGGINAPYTTELVWQMCQRYINNGVSYYFSNITSKIVEDKDIVDEIFIVLSRCLMCFNTHSESTFLMYFTSAINKRIERLLSKATDDVNFLKPSNKSQFVYEKEKTSNIEIDFTVEDIFTSIKLTANEKNIINLILNSVPVKVIIRKYTIEDYNQTLNKLKTYFDGKDEHQHFVNEKTEI